jgi:hypothetical protein
VSLVIPKQGRIFSLWSKLAKADSVPTEANLAAAYLSFAELKEACEDTMARFKKRVHWLTR